MPSIPDSIGNAHGTGSHVFRRSIVACSDCVGKAKRCRSCEAENETDFEVPEEEVHLTPVVPMTVKEERIRNSASMKRKELKVFCEIGYGFCTLYC